MAVNEETLEFKVLEFNKDSKKIIVSHARIHEEASAQEKAEESAKRKEDRDSQQKAVKKVKDSQEKTTLGDIEALSNLKSQMDKK